ncbi:LA virus GAG protein N-acetyltransferase [Diplonema papillatum]|nr:LA virus GAG protein N-acetyltransferase [Diplonema papillatum]
MPGKKSNKAKPAKKKSGNAAQAQEAHDEECAPQHDHEREPMPAAGPPSGLSEFVGLPEEEGIRYPVRGHPTQYVEYSQFSSPEELKEIIEMMTVDLSEPYPIFTYLYFIGNWPDLCWLAKLKDSADPSLCKMVGSITCKAEVGRRGVRGYVAMLAVLKQHRKHGYGSKLVQLAVDTMKKKGCTEVVLETETGNQGALSLYEGLGFVREKRLDRYYQQGTNAYRLKLWLVPAGLA